MQLWEVIVLGITQGLTEFLPVSSSGHLILVRQIFGISDVSGQTLDAFLHLGTFVAVFGYYWREWWQMVQAVWYWQDPARAASRRLLGWLVLATIPAVLAGYFFNDLVSHQLRGQGWLVAGFWLTAGVLLLDRIFAGDKNEQALRGSHAVFIGIAQAVALLPSVSRSATTIMGGRLVGLTRGAAVRFSFLLSTPVIFGAGVLSMVEFSEQAIFSWPVLLMGFLASLLSGWVAIRWVVRLVERMSLTPFAIYLVVVGLLAWYVG